MHTNDFEPLFHFTEPRVMITGEDEEGIWFLGVGDRKTSRPEGAVRMAPGEAAERLAARMGGRTVAAP